MNQRNARAIKRKVKREKNKLIKSFMIDVLNLSFTDRMKFAFKIMKG